MQQKIFTINQLVELYEMKTRGDVELESINITFIPSCALTRKNMYDKDTTYINPINIRINGLTEEGEKYINRVDMNEFKKQYGDDVGIRFTLRKDVKVCNGSDVNILKIDTHKKIYKGFTFYSYSIKGYSITDNSDKLFKELVETHKDDSPFQFRPKPYSDEIEDEI